jgi:two-component system sensor histidine kinase UhpB
MPLRLQINLITTAMLLCFASLIMGLQLENTRRSVREEMEGANMVATQLLTRLQPVLNQNNLSDTRQILSLLGRVRANEIELLSAQGQVLYQSPPSVYKAGREAPHWYSRIVSPLVTTREIPLAQGVLLVRADPSRAVLDGWDDFVPMSLLLLAGVVVVTCLVYALVGRALYPTQRVVQALQAVASGDYTQRLPALQGAEALTLSLAFNRMASSIEEGLQARAKAQEANLALAQSRHLAQEIQTRIEAVRGQIARELHDELGQQVTAVKSMGMAIARRAHNRDADIEDTARLVVACADHMYEDVHRLVTQLRPLALDRFGLKDALEDMVEEAASRHPDVALTLQIEGDLDDLADNLSTAVYRIMQESMTNALRHAKADRVTLQVWREPQVLQEVEPEVVRLEVRDNGEGPSASWSSTGHFGVVGMRERAHALGGLFKFETTEPCGTRVWVELPLNGETSNV